MKPSSEDRLANTSRGRRRARLTWEESYEGQKPSGQILHSSWRPLKKARERSDLCGPCVRLVRETEKEEAVKWRRMKKQGRKWRILSCVLTKEGIVLWKQWRMNRRWKQWRHQIWNNRKILRPALNVTILWKIEAEKKEKWKNGKLNNRKRQYDKHDMIWRMKEAWKYGGE